MDNFNLKKNMNDNPPKISKITNIFESISDDNLNIMP